MPGGSLPEPVDPKTGQLDPSGVTPPKETMGPAAYAAQQGQLAGQQPTLSEPAGSAGQQLQELIKGLQYQQAYGSDVTSTAQQISQLLGGMPVAQAQAILKTLPQGSPLATAVTNAAQGGQQKQSQAPTWDPLALQTMWASVFGPAFKQISQINQGAGTDYLSAMQQAIQGGGGTPQQQQQQLGNAQAMAGLLGQNARAQVGQVAAQPTYDSLIMALQNAAGAAQQAQGEAQKSIAYTTNTQAAQALNPALGGGGTSTLTPTQAGQALNQAIAGNQSAATLMPVQSPSAIPQYFSVP